MTTRLQLEAIHWLSTKYIPLCGGIATKKTLFSGIREKITCKDCKKIIYPITA